MPASFLSMSPRLGLGIGRPTTAKRIFLRPTGRGLDVVLRNELLSAAESPWRFLLHSPLRMARGELLRELFSSYSNSDDHAFRAAALAIIAEEQQKQNNQLAKELLTMLETPEPKKPAPLEKVSAPLDKERQAPLVEIRTPRRRMSDIVLSETAFGQVQRILEESRKAELLRAHSLRPKSKLLFCGPPGCGKTLCAEIVASELRLPLLYTRFDAIVSSYLGETSANIRRVFDFSKSKSYVILLDEFDAIGKSRDDSSEHGELRRVVNSFLQLLDSYTGDSIIIAATNHEQILDDALWRRFDEIVPFERPANSEVLKLLSLKLKNFPCEGLNFVRLAPKLSGFSHSEIEWVCMDAVKSAILQDIDAVTPALFEASLERQKRRAGVMKGPRR